MCCVFDAVTFAGVRVSVRACVVLAYLFAISVSRRYNVFQVARSLGLPRVNVVYMDGHTQSPMDEVWNKLTVDVKFIKHIPPHTCFTTAVFVPFGCGSLLVWQSEACGRVCWFSLASPCVLL